MKSAAPATAAAGVDSLALDRQLCFALYTASRAVIRAYAPLLAPLGLTYPQYLTMLALWAQDGVAVKTLGEQLALDSATLTPLLKRLEQQGIVERRRDTGDERVVRIHLTARGRALQTRARSVPAALACRAGFDVADERAVGRLVRLRQDLRALAHTLRSDDDDDDDDDGDGDGEPAARR